MQSGTALPQPISCPTGSSFAPPGDAFAPSAETGAAVFLVTLVPGMDAWGVVPRTPGSAMARQGSFPKWRRWFMARVKWPAAALVPNPSLGPVNGPALRIK